MQNKHKLTSIIPNRHGEGALATVAIQKKQQRKRKHSMATSSFGLLAMTALSICLTSCEQKEQIDRSTAKGEAMYMARMINHNIHTAYLNNYALDEKTKAKGLEQLAARYIQRNWQQTAEYIQEFGYECEKLGFKEFLQAQKLPCKKLTESPLFDSQINAYWVKCAPEGSYKMWFDYDTKQWDIRL